ncbi:MAG: CARDB domain-containing protein [Gaiellaceae bacterium]
MRLRASRRVRNVFLFVTLAVAAVSLPLASSNAATPDSGTVSASNLSVSWTGAIAIATAAGCTGATDPTCDKYHLTVQPPGYPFQVRIELLPAGDWDLYVYAPDGGLAGSSGNGPNQLEIVTLTNPPAGTYTIAAAPFAPLIGTDGNSYTASATIVPISSGSQPPPGTEPITYSNYSPPGGLGGSAGEPSIGANWTGPGNVMYQAGLQTLRVSFDDTRSPATASWTDVSAPNTSLASLDPIGFMDQTTGRWFSSQLSGTTSLAAFTDNDGGSWLPSEGGPLNGGVDHQTIGAGPYAPPLTGTVYPHAFYYCSQDLVAALCARSDNGGVTFSPAVPIYTSECGGLHGHVKVAPDGTVYVPNRGCGGAQGVVVSRDNGLTWSVHTVPGSTNGAWDPSVGIASDGTVYFGYDDGDGHPRVAVSHDHGSTWTNIRDVGVGLNVATSAFPAVVAGDPDRAAFAFLGTTYTGSGAFGDTPSWPGVWHLYVATTYDGGNTWTTVDATPTDPVQKSTICGGGFNGCGNGTRNLLDFMDATIDKDGRVLVGYADGCIDTCVTGGPNSYTALTSIARQVNGKRLFARFDQNTVPAAPNLNGKALAGSPPSNLLTWEAPYNGGSAITGYKIYRKTASSGYSVLATVRGSATNYSDTQLTAGETYTYKVSAVNANGEGAASNEVTPTPPPPPADPCVEPGVRVISDGTGDALDGNDGHDVQWVSVAEPSSAGSGKLEFIVKVASLASVPANTTWPVIFQTADGADHFVRMKTDVLGNVTFGYGNGTTVAGDATPADTASRYTGDGTIRIVVARSVFGAAVGSNLTQFLIRVRVESGAGPALTPDNAPDSLGRTGSYTVKGNENCSTPQADLAMTGNDIVVSGLQGAGHDQVIVAVVHNIGTGPAANVKVRIAVDGTQIGAIQTIGSIPVGGSGRASVVWDTHGQNGTHSISAVADPANAIPESNEGNNTGTRTVTVQGGKVH